MMMAASLAASPAGAIQPPSDSEAVEADTDAAPTTADDAATPPGDQGGDSAAPATAHDDHAGHADHQSGQGGAAPESGSPAIPPLDDDSTGGNGRPDRDPVKPG